MQIFDYIIITGKYVFLHIFVYPFFFYLLYQIHVLF